MPECTFAMFASLHEGRTQQLVKADVNKHSPT